MNKKRLLIIACTLLVLIKAGIGITWFIKTHCDTSVVARIQTVKHDEENAAKTKKISNYDVLANRNIKKIHGKHKFKEAEKIKFDARKVERVFDTYIKNQTVHFKLVKKVPLYDQNKRRVNDNNYWKMLKCFTRKVHTNVTELTLFKIDGHYYIFTQINQWILDPSELYEYSPQSDNLKKLCELDNKDVVNINR
ncbi:MULTISPECIES: hypothetical protein [Lactobacillus]|uniref:hypothetical protein n=1 Tax=Lactobacillus TaxID=1578 RepID=UPI00191C1B1F|nr:MULTISPECIES: hypothetical protein [Lactobacillus]